MGIEIVGLIEDTVRDACIYMKNNKGAYSEGYIELARHKDRSIERERRPRELGRETGERES